MKNWKAKPSSDSSPKHLGFYLPWWAIILGIIIYPFAKLVDLVRGDK
jgi:hypothetical protein